MQMGIPRRPFELLGRAAMLPLHRPLIPFLKEPWSSKSKWPAILLQVFFYGIYVVLSACCTYTLWQQKVVRRASFFITSILFCLASADIIVTIYFFFRFIVQRVATTSPTPSDPHETWNRTLEIKFAVYVVSNAIASSVLINRCYTVWENRRIIVAPIALVIIGTVISFVSISASQLGDKLLAASFITSAAANLSVTLMIVTRMWWTSRKVRRVVRMDLSTIAGYILSLLVDSGALYSFSIFLYLVFHTLVIDASLTQIAVNNYVLIS
ncbi:hypothetical protein BDN70DRAFT_688992 [Pholiota conissans]|uniref:Transmembrane protein n=1 Tax=Pholiota conissans TaxID=109636 RepID=A0A9P6D1C4_9AGAR|nr:hypothetical protein BDN70DRAFT_688992 [Pholiota conissans]